MKFLLVGVFVLLVCGVLGAKLNRFQRQTVRAHAKLRRRHGKTPQLKWSPTVAKFAQDWCDSLKENDNFEHSKGSGYGENIYMGSAAAGAGSKAVSKWYDEVADYDFDKPGFAYKTSHFTQVTII